MSNFYNHAVWFIFLTLLSILSFFLSLYVTYYSSLLLSVNFLSSWNFPLSLSVLFDQYSCWFITVVLTISSVVIVYSFFYISPYHKSYYFLTLTLMFIVSIILVICFNNLLFIMLGWDGLGLVSFFLIVYFQNASSIFSGIFTLLINRLGDAFFLCSIVLFSYLSYDLFTFNSVVFPPVVIFFITITFMTKSAIFPFSPWLPIAIAAPTPISALVHSSTLVTSGLFLMINYSYVLYSSYTIISILLVLSVFTSFYAGINTVFENDFNNLIALSTLSHLGFIGITFSLGMLSLSFFHLLTHALFKSVLFISIGEIIINLCHSQDIRFLSQGSNYTPFSCFTINVSLLNLLGFPSLSGFWSNDLILETLNYSNCSIYLYYISLFNLFFTFYYSFQLFYYSFQLSKCTTSYYSFHSILFLHSFLVCSLALCSLFFGYLFLSNFTIFFPSIPLFLKLYPFFLILSFFFILVLNKSLFTSHSQLINSYFSSIIFLYYFITNTSSNIYYFHSFWVSNTLELGVLNSSFNLKLPSYTFLLSTFILKFSLLNPFKLIVYSLSFIFLITIMLQ